ncbi:MAG: hypothetical protein GYA36_17395 [Veillonellaceae bacterium]|nr:hypothetical protein [Veillonellaceae bacterium]
MYVITAAEAMKTPARPCYTPHGAVLEFIYARDPEVIIAGPSETGKTLGACWKLHTIACKYPNAQLAIVRKVQASLYSTVCETLQNRVFGKTAPVMQYGGERPEKYIYQNGSVIWLGGLDKESKVLSSERDIIYVNQAEELTESEWETLLTRTTGRANNLPYSMLMGDANPAGSRHWILQRANRGILRLIRSTHRDNPTLYDEFGNLTERGERTMARLDALTGVRKRRLRDGEWASAEGAVYSMFDQQRHVCTRDYGEFDYWALAVDEGFACPSVALLLGVDKDMRVHVYNEFYRRSTLPSDFVQHCLVVTREHQVCVAVCDAAAAGLIADLRAVRINAVPGPKGRIIDGIRLVQDMLADDPPRLTVSPLCVETINEFESYCWRPGEVDVPLDMYDHTMDALRYFVSWLQAGDMQLIQLQDGRDL